MTKTIKTGAGGPYSIRPVQFKGLQYRVDDRDGGSVYLTRSLVGAQRRVKQLNASRDES
jgi:hypothetical protein